MEQGVTLMDPARFDLRGTLTCGQDVIIDVNVVIEGDVTLATVYKSARQRAASRKVGADTLVHPNCVIENAEIGRRLPHRALCAHRPETRIAAHVHIGNFVEIKKSSSHRQQGEPPYLCG